MRLKEDKSNWKATNIIRKLVLPPEEPKHHSHKSTRRWCKGKVGIEHVYKLFEQHDSEHWHYKLFKCVHCKKEKYG